MKAKKDEKIKRLEHEIISEFIEIRKSQKICRSKLANMANITRQTVERIEHEQTSPNISTILELLKPLDYTLEIVPLEDEKNSE